MSHNIRFPGVVFLVMFNFLALYRHVSIRNPFSSYDSFDRISVASFGCAKCFNS